MTQSQIPQILHGISVASGGLLGKSWFKKELAPHVVEGAIQPGNVAAEWERLLNALKLSKVQLEKIRASLEREIDAKHAGIFDFYMLLIEDDTLLDSIRSQMENRLVTAEAARVFAASPLRLLGVESQTVGPEDAPMEVHRILLGADKVLLEGLRLARVPDGRYFLSALPLNLGDADGAPCRAVLMT